MANIQFLKDGNGVRVYPVTHEKAVRDSSGTSLETKLQNFEAKTYVVAWDGTSSPSASSIPSGATVTYNDSTVTGTKAASSSTVGKIYLVSNGEGEYSRYITSQSGSNYSWTNIGSTAMTLEVIDDDTSGGSGKPWSAERGKAIRSDVEGLAAEVAPIVATSVEAVEVDVPSLTLRYYLINSSGENVGKYGSNMSYRHVIYRVYPGQSVKVTASATNSARISFFKSNAAPVANEYPDYCDEYASIYYVSIAAGSSKSFMVPEDAKYIYIYRGLISDSYPFTPSSVIVYKPVAATLPVDNLITEDATLPLSANQGVVLSGFSTESTTILRDDLNSTNVIGGRISSSNTWQNTSRYFHFELPVEPGQQVIIKAYSSYDTIYAFLTTAASTVTPVNNEPVPLVAETEAVTLPAGTMTTIVVPNTAKVLYLYSGDANSSSASKYYNRPEYVIVRSIAMSVAREAASQIAGIKKFTLDRDEYSYFIGKGTAQVVAVDRFYGIIPGQTYRMVVLNPDAELADTSGSNYRLQIEILNEEDSSIGNIVQVSTATTLWPFYDFVIPEGGYSIKVKGRCVTGEVFPFLIRRVDSGAFAGGSITNVNPDFEFYPKFRSAYKRYYTSTYTSAPYPVVFLHISDIHGNWDNVKRFIEFGDHWKKFITGDLINTGDTMENTLTEGGTNGYAAIPNVGRILNVIGNHDTRGSEGWQQYIGLPVYNALIGPYVSGWTGVVQPDDAAENGYCYYYKDYSASNLRLICVDVMGYDENENTWLANTLAVAKELGYHVLIAAHFAGSTAPGHGDDPAFTKFDCNYSTKYSMGGASDGLNGYNANTYMMMQTVDDFQQAGGYFVGYIQGHYHADFVAKVAAFPNQLIYSIGASKAGEMRDYYHAVGTRMQDDFQIVSVDTYGKLVKLFKVGANVDRHGRHKNSICVSYDTHEIVAEGY